MEILRLEEREVLLLASGFLSLEVFMSFTVASFNHLPEAAAVCTFYIKKKKNSIIVSSRDTAATAKLLQSCPTLCNPIDGSPPGSPGPRILQARTLEWVAISFSNA